MSIRIATAILLATIASASPAGIGQGPSNHTLDIRDYPVSCGYNNAYPCMAGQTCFTSNNVAMCTGGGQAAPAGGNYGVYTTTYTLSETYTVTSTYTSQIGGATGSGSDNGVCDSSKGQHICNPNLCCSSDQWCDNGTRCMAYGAAGSPNGSPGLPAATYITTMTVGGTPTTISNFIAPTSVTVTTITSSGTATTTLPFETPIGSTGATLSGVTAQSQSSGLSGGAIAGIVIGVLLGLLILFIILACLCCKGIFDLIFGRKKKTETTEYIATHHSHHGGSASHRPPPRRWFGILPAKADRPDRPEKKSGLGGLLAVGGALAGLAVVLGLKRRNDRRRDDEKSDYTRSDDYYSDYYTETSASSASSDDRRTRNTHRSQSRSRR